MTIQLNKNPYTQTNRNVSAHAAPTNSTPKAKVDLFSRLPQELFYQIAYYSQNLSIIRLSRSSCNHWKEVEGEFYTELLRYYKLHVVLLRNLALPKFQSPKGDRDTFIALYSMLIKQSTPPKETPNALVTWIRCKFISAPVGPLDTNKPTDIANPNVILTKIADREREAKLKLQELVESEIEQENLLIFRS